jgi:putative transposase
VLAGDHRLGNQRGQKRFLAIEDRVRESTQSWRAVLSDLKRRGVKLAVGDGAWVSGARWRRCSPRRASSAAGCTRRGRSSTICPRRRSRRPRRCRLRSGWRRPAPMRSVPSIVFLPATRRSIPRPPSAWRRTETACSPSTTSRPSIGSVCARPTPSSRASRRSGIAPTGPRAALRATLLGLVFKLAMSAEKHWHRLRGFPYLANVVRGVKFVDRVKQEK